MTGTGMGEHEPSRYKDNGIGIPADFDWRDAKSLGLRLVCSLVEQLDGTIELDRTTGTAFTIVVKEKE
jgi:two-component sensor histidine kinase